MNLVVQRSALYFMAASPHSLSAEDGQTKLIGAASSLAHRRRSPPGSPELPLLGLPQAWAVPLGLRRQRKAQRRPLGRVRPRHRRRPRRVRRQRRKEPNQRGDRSGKPARFRSTERQRSHRPMAILVSSSSLRVAISWPTTPSAHTLAVPLAIRKQRTCWFAPAMAQNLKSATVMC